MAPRGQGGRALSVNGAKYALHKVTQPGRYLAHCEEEVDPMVAGDEEW